MKPSLIAQVLPSLIKERRPVCITGAPGGGKTSIVHQVAKAHNLAIIEKHLPTMLVEDFGIPWPSAEGQEFAYKLPDWYPYAGKPGLPEFGILLFDDRNQANQDLQKVLANIQQARTLHGVPLAEGWSVVSTGNRQADRAGANRILSHLADREFEIEYETNLDDWCDWALRNGVSHVVVSYVRFKPNMLHNFDPNRDKNPTPRSWAEGVSAVYGRVPAEVELELYKGRVGEAAAIEFKAFSDMYRQLPSPDAIMLNPETHEVPAKGNVLYALAGALAHRATKDNFERVITYARRMPAEFLALLLKDALSRDASLATTKTFSSLAANEMRAILA